MLSKLKTLEIAGPSLKIYKSSAGSGKTYQLVLNYLTLILTAKDPNKFKKILAITFTNKASKEMKERVLQGLQKLKSGTDTQFVQDYVHSTGLPPHELSEKSQDLLTNILHNYGHLNILTIDKFVHRIIRSFSRELGLTTNFELTFDFDTITARCIDEVLQELGNNTQLTKVLVEYYQQLIDQEDNPNIEKSLKDKTKILGKEESVKKLDYYKEKDLSFFQSVRKDTRKKIQSLRKQSISQKEELVRILGPHLPNLKNGRSNYSLLLNGLEEFKKSPRTLSEPQVKNIQQHKWISKKAEGEFPELAEILSMYGEKIQQLFLSINQNAHQEIFLKYLDSNLMSFALLNDVQQQIEKLKTDNNLVLIGELNQIISEIISKESAPYIYEKIGARFENYFVDEFQDTSELQWKNLIPLVHESLAHGHENLIVGDAKQSIYRWRGGNAEQFINLPEVNADVMNLSEINQSFAHSYEGYVLENNYRSAQSIIEFNNWFFPQLTDYLASPLLTNIYRDVNQETKREEIGYLEVKIYKAKTDYNIEQSYDPDLLRQINDCITDGYRFKDLCILVRKNSEGTEIAQYLNEHNLPVTSQESLLLSDSAEVRLIHALLKATQKQTNENILRVFTLFKSTGLVELFEEYRIPSIKNDFYSDGYDFDKFLALEIPELDLAHFKELSIYDQVDYLVKILQISREDLYVDKLINAVYDFQRKHGHQTTRFIEYLEEKILNSSVVPPENIDAIKIMTIHKSKGLQFPVILIPKRISSNNPDDLWISGELLSELGLSEMNMNPGKNVPDENIQKTQEIHKEYAELDLINLIYVAYTRAENRLFIHLEESYGSPLLKQQINLISSHPNYNLDSTKLTLGNRENYQSDQIRKSPDSLKISTIDTHNWREKLILAVPVQLEDLDNSISDRNWGVALHEILQNLNNLSSYSKVIESFIQKRKEWSNYENKLRNTIKSFTENETIQQLYQDPINILSEQSLATSYGEILRPDKVLEKEKEVIVIDFKTGTALPKHKQQILKYGHILEQIYQKPIKLYLIYLSDKIKVIHV